MSLTLSMEQHAFNDFLMDTAGIESNQFSAEEAHQASKSTPTWSQLCTRWHVTPADVVQLRIALQKLKHSKATAPLPEAAREKAPLSPTTAKALAEAERTAANGGHPVMFDERLGVRIGFGGKELKEVKSPASWGEIGLKCSSSAAKRTKPISTAEKEDLRAQAQASKLAASAAKVRASVPIPRTCACTPRTPLCARHASLCTA